MDKPPLDTIRPGENFPFDRERREGEIYARSARVQLSLFSFVKLVAWLAVVEGMLTAGVNHVSLITRGQEIDPVGLALTFSFAILVGATKLLVAALLVFPVYNWIAEKRRGQVMRGKLSVIIPIDDSVAPVSDPQLHKETREDEVYARMARIQLSFPSFIKFAAWVAVSEGVLTASFITVWLISQGVDMGVFGFMANFARKFFNGLLGVLIAALVVFPIYWWMCEKRRGQVMRGKFSVAVDASNDSLNSDAQKPRAG